MKGLTWRLRLVAREAVARYASENPDAPIGIAGARTYQLETPTQRFRVVVYRRADGATVVIKV